MITKFFRLLALLGSAAVLTACSETSAPLGYQLPAAIAPSGPRAIGSVTSSDLRGEKDPSWYGAVRGGFGNPLKVLHTPGPLAETVRDDVSQALASRGLQAPGAGAPLALHVDILTYYSDQYINRETTIDLRFVLRRSADSQVVYDDHASVDAHEDNDPFTVGIFGSVEKLRAFNQRNLDALIDTALSRPGFRAALREASTARPNS